MAPPKCRPQVPGATGQGSTHLLCSINRAHIPHGGHSASQVPERLPSTPHSGVISNPTRESHSEWAGPAEGASRGGIPVGLQPQELSLSGGLGTGLSHACLLSTRPAVSSGRASCLRQRHPQAVACDGVMCPHACALLMPCPQPAVPSPPPAKSPLVLELLGCHCAGHGRSTPGSPSTAGGQ